MERAYLTELLRREVDLWGLARIPGDVLLFDRGALQAMAIDKADAALDIRGHLTPWRDADRRRAEAAARRRATHRAPARELARLLRTAPASPIYLNIGHTNLRAETMAALSAIGATIVVMIHDTIPLDHPDLVRAGTEAAFRRRLAAVSGAADLVLYPSAATAGDAERWCATLGRVPSGAVLPLGLAPPEPVEARVSDPPAFVTLGTIEPRKNHALLLDIWERLTETRGADAMPHLHVIGARGWAAPALLRRLEHGAATGKTVFHLGPLPDAEVRARLAGSLGLLFPSLAEGFGLPIAEALQLGVPVLASDLPALRATGGSHARYLPLNDPDAWTAAILAQARPDAPRPAKIRFQDWETHVNELLTRLSAMV